MPRSTGDDWEAAVAAALAPYAWRGLTERMLVRMVIGAVDRHSVLRFLATMPGTCVGEMPRTEPADAGDERVHALLRALDGRRWRTWSLARLCAGLFRSLESWQTERESLDSDLRRLLEGR